MIPALHPVVRTAGNHNHPHKRRQVRNHHDVSNQAVRILVRQRLHELRHEEAHGVATNHHSKVDEDQMPHSPVCQSLHHRVSPLL